MLSEGLLDCAMVVFMVVGHTKFGPDLVARQMAGIYSREDAFNHGQLVRMMTPYATAGAYDDELFNTWKAGSQKLFSPITHIMSYRCFLLLEDDGQVRLGEPVGTPHKDMEPYADLGPLYTDAALMREFERAARRSLTDDVLPSLRTNTYHGVGRSSVVSQCQNPQGAMLLPAEVTSCRKARLFTRRRAEDPLWREQVAWMQNSSLLAVNDALAAVKPYKDDPAAGKEPYDAKAKSIMEMYAKYVPLEYAPARFDVPRTGDLRQTHLNVSAGVAAGASQRDITACTQASPNGRGQWWPSWLPHAAAGEKDAVVGSYPRRSAGAVAVGLSV